MEQVVRLHFVSHPDTELSSQLPSEVHKPVKGFGPRIGIDEETSERVGCGRPSRGVATVARLVDVGQKHGGTLIVLTRGNTPNVTRADRVSRG